MGCGESGVKEGEGNHGRHVKTEVRLEVKLEISLGWLQMRLPRIA